jgi:rubrerythrin
VSEIPDDLHSLDSQEFLEEVHSFEFWFQSIQGYLTDRPWGQSPDTPEVELDDEAKARLITTLCNYCIGEAAALDGASGLVRIAPNHETRVFLATQAVDEARHLEVLLHRLRDLGFEGSMEQIEARATKSLLQFRRRLRELVDGGDWEAALFAQNVILEAMEFAAFHNHAANADPRTKELLEGIIKDERRHMGFGENELGRCLARAPHLRARLSILRRELDPLVLGSFAETLERLTVPATERDKFGRAYFAVVERLGFGDD